MLFYLFIVKGTILNIFEIICRKWYYIEFLIQEIKGSFMQYFFDRRGDFELDRVEDHCIVTDNIFISYHGHLLWAYEEMRTDEESDYSLLTFKIEASGTVPGTQKNLRLCLLIWIHWINCLVPIDLAKQMKTLCKLPLGSCLQMESIYHSASINQMLTLKTPGLFTAGSNKNI